MSSHISNENSNSIILTKPLEALTYVYSHKI